MFPRLFPSTEDPLAPLELPPISHLASLFLLGEELLLELDAELLAEGRKLLDVLLVLGRGLDLSLDSCWQSTG